MLQCTPAVDPEPHGRDELSSDANRAPEPHHQTTDRAAPDHTLSVIGSWARRIEELAQQLSTVEFRILIHLWSRQQSQPNGFRISNRELATNCKIAVSGIHTAIPNLIRLGKITFRAGGTREPSFYRVCAFDSIEISDLKFESPPPRQRLENQVTADLFSSRSELEFRVTPPPNPNNLPAPTPRSILTQLR